MLTDERTPADTSVTGNLRPWVTTYDSVQCDSVFPVIGLAPIRDPKSSSLEGICY